MLIDLVAFPLATLTENDQSLICNAFQLNKDSFKQLKQLSNDLSNARIGDVSVETEFGSFINLSEELDQINDGINARFAIAKTGSYPIFFTQQAFESRLKTSTSLEGIFGLLFSNQDFGTLSTCFYGVAAVLANNVAALPTITEGEPVAKFVKSLNGKAIQFLPHNTIQWLSKDVNVLPDYWKKNCAAKLFCTLATEVIVDRDTINATFRSDRRVTISMSLSEEKPLIDNFESIHKIAEWVYVEGRDVETRHVILNNQVCLLSSADIALLHVDFKQVADRLLESSMLAYRYYLQNSSKELTKSLTEISKTLFEHINKIRQNTVDLVNGLWRDFTTAFGLMILNFSLKKPDISNLYWKWILIGLMIYLAISLYLGSSISFWFYYRLRASLVDMRSRIYGYLTDDDFNKYALHPLKSAQKKFVRTFWWVLLCYLAIMFLVWQSIRFADAPKDPMIFKFVDSTPVLTTFN